MKSFAHWGWTIILLVVFMIATVISMLINLANFGGTGMELFYSFRFFLVPAMLGVGIATLVALLSMLVAKNLFKHPRDAFFLPLNCMLLVEILTRIAYPVLDLLFSALESMSGFSLY